MSTKQKYEKIKPASKVTKQKNHNWDERSCNEIWECYKYSTYNTKNGGYRKMTLEDEANFASQFTMRPRTKKEMLLDFTDAGNVRNSNEIARYVNLHLYRLWMRPRGVSVSNHNSLISINRESRGCWTRVIDEMIFKQFFGLTRIYNGSKLGQ
jgi:hypothetical protein